MNSQTGSAQVARSVSGSETSSLRVFLHPLRQLFVARSEVEYPISNGQHVGVPRERTQRCRFLVKLSDPFHWPTPWRRITTNPSSAPASSSVQSKPCEVVKTGCGRIEVD